MYKTGQEVQICSFSMYLLPSDFSKVIEGLVTSCPALHILTKFVRSNFLLEEGDITISLVVRERTTLTPSDINAPKPGISLVCLLVGGFSQQQKVLDFGYFPDFSLFSFKGYRHLTK